MTTTIPEFGIYVACLAAYNNGQLHGEWIDATQDPEDIQAEVSAMLAASPQPNAEEWAIHDYCLGGISIGEWESFENVSKIANLVEEHGAAFAAYVDHMGLEYSAQDWDATQEGFEESYRGEYSSMADFAEEYVSEINEIPEYLQCYIDWEKFGHDLEIDDFFTADADSGVYVFSRC
jgi:antirestriction protein